MGSEHHEAILRVTKDVGTKASLDGYIHEALSTWLPLLAIPILRLLSLGLDPPFEGIYRMLNYFPRPNRDTNEVPTGTALKDYSVRGLTIKEGDRLFLNIAEANLDVGFLSF